MFLIKNSDIIPPLFMILIYILKISYVKEKKEAMSTGEIKI